MTKWPISVIRKMQIKDIFIYHHPPITLAKMKKLDSSKWLLCFGKSLALCRKVEDTYPNDAVILFLGTSPKKRILWCIRIYEQKKKKKNIRTMLATLSGIATNWKQPKYSSRVQCILSYNGILCKNEIN